MAPPGAKETSIGDIDLTIIEMAPKVLNGVCLPNRAPLMRALDHSNVHVNVNTKYVYFIHVLLLALNIYYLPPLRHFVTPLLKERLSYSSH